MNKGTTLIRDNYGAIVRYYFFVNIETIRKVYLGIVNSFTCCNYL